MTNTITVVPPLIKSLPQRHPYYLALPSRHPSYKAPPIKAPLLSGHISDISDI